MRFTPLCSGSSGNASYLDASSVRLLIDAGGTGKRIASLLIDAGADPKELDGILLTHEHIDHVMGVGVLSRRYKLPVYASAACFAALPPSVGPIAPELMRVFEPDRPFTLKGLTVHPFPIPHDSQSAVGYRFSDSSGCVVSMTDIGCMSDGIYERIAGADVLLIEANHDVDMLKAGSYPYPLKRRILSECGHLSNEACADTIVRLAREGMREFILGHLSRENNTPDLAAVTVRAALLDAGFGREVRVTVAKRDSVTGTFSTEREEKP